MEWGSKYWCYPSAISFKNRGCTLSGPLALKGSRFFIWFHFHVMVLPNILTSFGFNIEKSPRLCWTISWEGLRNKIAVCMLACFSCYISSFSKVIPIWCWISSFCLYIQLLFSNFAFTSFCEVFLKAWMSKSFRCSFTRHIFSLKKVYDATEFYP